MSGSKSPSDVPLLTDDLDTLKAFVLAEREEADRLRAIINALQPGRFERNTEILKPDHLRLGHKGKNPPVAINLYAPGRSSEHTIRSFGPIKKKADFGNALLARLPILVCF